MKVRDLNGGRWPSGHDPDRAADAGAGRSANDLRSDLELSLESLEAAWDALDDDLWDRQAVMMAGPRTMAEIVRHHWRNIEVHHVDLDIGYRTCDWPEDFVDGELARRLGALANRADHAELLAWLIGRAPAPELSPW
jgi:maleylpyruvate isomerase